MMSDIPTKKPVNKNITIDEFMSLAKKTPNHGSLVQAFENHPTIEFEYVEVSRTGKHLKITRPKE